MERSVSSARFSELVGAVYDCVVDPRLWPETLDAVRTEMRFATAVLSSHSLTSGRLLLEVNSGIDAEWLERMHDFDGEMFDLWGGPEVSNGFPVGEPGLLSQVNPRAFAPTPHRYIVEWGWPQGLIDTLAVVVARDGAAVGTMAFGRHGAEGPIGENEITLARLLAPHVQRSVAISRLLDVVVIAQAFGDVIERLAAPVMLVARDGRVLHRNAAARLLLEDGAVLAARGGRLTSSDPQAARRLREAVDQCDRDESVLTRSASGFPVRDFDGRVHAVHVLPLGRGSVRTALMREAAAAILVSSPASPVGATADAVAALFDLTPAEARVFGLIASGATPAEVATALAVAPTTVKTHLKRVFAKLGVRRQVDLARLAANLASPLAEPDDLRSRR